jgi:DUF4097 and DUF4098 domain-containing protein YvlB
MNKWWIVGIIGISLFAICLGSIVAFLPVLNQAWSGDFQWNLFSVNNISADAVEEQRATVDGPANVKVNTPFGKVDITAAEDSREIVISAHKYAWGVSLDAAEKLLEKIDVVVKQNGNSVEVFVDQPVEVDLFHIGPAGISVDFTISVPPDCNVDASSSSGDVRLAGITGHASLHSSFGKVTAENITGGVNAGTSSGDVAVTGISAADDSVEAVSSFGDVLVKDVHGNDLTAKSSSGEVTVEDSSFTWDAKLNTSFGDIQATSLGARSLDARTSSGRVRLENLKIENDLVAHSDFGDVDVVRSTAGSYDLDTNSGKVTAGGAQGSVKARSGFGDVKVSGTDVVLDLSTNSGSIEFSGTLGGGTSVLQTSFGDIRVLLPEGSEFTVDLSTNFGDVRCGFPMTTEQGGDTYLTGTVGEGGPALKASTNSGNVSVYPQTPG